MAETINFLSFVGKEKEERKKSYRSFKFFDFFFIMMESKTCHFREVGFLMGNVQQQNSKIVFIFLIISTNKLKGGGGRGWSEDYRILNTNICAFNFSVPLLLTCYRESIKSFNLILLCIDFFRS